jgi:hypothetical protein
MDPHFVGLIFSVYNSDPLTMVETRDLIAFQAKEDSQVWILCALELRMGSHAPTPTPHPHENVVFFLSYDAQIFALIHTFRI